MNVIINIARLHIQLRLKDNATYLLLFAMPIGMMALLGYALNFGEPRLLLDVVDEDRTTRSAEFIAELEAVAAEGETVMLCVYGASNLEECDLDMDAVFNDSVRLKEGDTSAVLMIPAGFGDSLDEGQQARLIYQTDEGLNAGSITRTTVDTAISRYASSLVIASVGVSEAEEFLTTYADDSQRTAAFEILLSEARTGLGSPPVRISKESTGQEVAVGQGANQSVPGIATMFVLIALLGMSADLVVEREQGTLQRLFALPSRKVNIVGGKVLGGYGFGIAQFCVFILVGMIIGVEWGTNYAAIGVIVITYCWMGTALGFLLATLVRTSDQAAGISTMIAMILAPLGVAWWPLEIVPDVMKTAAHISPIAWAMEAFGDIIYYNGGLVDVLPEAAVLVAFGMIFMTLAVWRFRYE